MSHTTVKVGLESRITECKAAGSGDVACISKEQYSETTRGKLSLGSVRTSLGLPERQLSTIPVRQPPTRIGLLSVMQALIVL